AAFAFVAIAPLVDARIALRQALDRQLREEDPDCIGVARFTDFESQPPDRKCVRGRCRGQIDVADVTEAIDPRIRQRTFRPLALPFGGTRLEPAALVVAPYLEMMRGRRFEDGHIGLTGGPVGPA